MEMRRFWPRRPSRNQGKYCTRTKEMGLKSASWRLSIQPLQMLGQECALCICCLVSYRRMGYETWLPAENGNGTWVKFNGQNSIKNVNHIPAHSTASDERLGNAVETAVEANWGVVQGLVKGPGPGPELEAGSVGNPFPPFTPTVTPTPLRKTHLKTDQTDSVGLRPLNVNGNPAQLSPVSLSTLGRLMKREALEGLLLLCLLLLCILGLVALWRRSASASSSSNKNKIHIKPRAHVPISLLIPKQQDAPRSPSAKDKRDPRDPFSNSNSNQSSVSVSVSVQH